MKLTSRSSLAEVVACVAQALARAKIRAVLTGGACATIYSKGEYQSSDLDFVLQSAITPGPEAGQSPGRKNVSSRPQTITPIHRLSETTATSFAVRGASDGAFGAVARRYVVM